MPRSGSMNDCTKEMNKVADQVKALGFRVFIRDGGDTYAHFTDGKSFGYVQIGDYGYGYSIGSVHKPNKQTGTGFQISKPERETEYNKWVSAFARNAEMDEKQIATGKAFIAKYETAKAEIEGE